MSSSPTITPLIHKLARRDALSDEERSVLAGLLGPERHVPAGGLLVEPGDRPGFSTFLVSGFCARYSLTVDGGRQLTEVNVPGDFVDLHSLLMRQMDHGVVALGDCVIAPAAHADLRRLTESHPHLARLLWLETVVDGAIHRQWLVTMGQQNAASRLAHLVCELYRRLESAGLARDYRFSIPMTQVDLGDVLGLTPVHVNRVLMDLRQQGLLEWRAGLVTIPDWDSLVSLGQFDPTYLRLQSDVV
ncbi:Crp/Fnr family transcriptional regulator [Caulobacter sp. UNC358MFTsu5.1]|uniref:Crp/Fnr family transcriptional regulator n=1 Tax=Caulobacter sp. UNC358MFTsu5.1 TaxID=1449049 RepID=UPI0004A6C4BE|nr:Crp/Fnr family transcriptional regulator [Caulobacter sp. UNC358MFTsu5.1]